MEYHIFKKSKRTKDGKKKTEWYYWFWNVEHTKQIQRACKGCKTKYEAELYIQQLHPQTLASCLIKDICAAMYIPGSMNFLRREQLGKSIKENTLRTKRLYIRYIIKDFGDLDIRDLTATMLLRHLMLNNSHSASWKNQYITTIEDVYTEAIWNGIEVNPPRFERFAQKSKKADILTMDEIKRLFVPENFPSEASYLLLLLTLSAGLRISEARAFTPEQLFFEQSAILVNGFLDRYTDVRNPYNKTGSEEDKRWRIALIPPGTAVLLRDFINKTGKKDDELLFTHWSKKRHIENINGMTRIFDLPPSENPYHMEHIEDIFHNAVKKAGIDTNGRKITMHSLRYTYVTRMRNLYAGETVRKMVGHAEIEMTDYYTRNELQETLSSLAAQNAKMIEFFDSSSVKN